MAWLLCGRQAEGHSRDGHGMYCVLTQAGERTPLLQDAGVSAPPSLDPVAFPEAEIQQILQKLTKYVAKLT